MRCKICSEEKTGPEHDLTPKHLKNKALYEYSEQRKKHTGNRNGVVVKCNVKSSFSDILDNADPKIKISAKPNEEIKFQFTIFNESKKDDILLMFFQIPYNKLNFVMNNYGLSVGCEPRCLKPKQKLQPDVYVTFKSPDIGQYQMPVAILFQKKETGEKIFIARDMVVFVEEKLTVHEKVPTPYAGMEVKAEKLYKTTAKRNGHNKFPIPPNYKALYAAALRPRADAPQQLKEIAQDISNVFETRATKENYVRYFHCLLWYEETIVRINLKKYNMRAVSLEARGRGQAYALQVPGLAEKRPSLLINDLLFVKPSDSDEAMFEGVISEIQSDTIVIKGLDPKFSGHYLAGSTFDIRFFMSRMSLERMHMAVDEVLRAGLEPVMFPVRNEQPLFVDDIHEFFNPLVADNPEQRRAVVRGAGAGGGPAPFLLHGPPGTGKTVTLAEIALQVLKRQSDSRVLICTDSNMAADHVASVLARYHHHFGQGFLLRANSKHRVWESLPDCLHKFSNGKCAATFEAVTTEQFLAHRIIVTTLLHSAKFAEQFKGKRVVTHVMIDEAAQASEPACSVACRLLRLPPRLLLAGDPRQLPPCVISRAARRHGLGLSLMERLMGMELYQSGDPDYTVMLRNNFRSHPDIIALPNELFYDGKLRACAADDPLSRTCVVSGAASCRGVVFHGVLSQEHRVGKSPSYFNPLEASLVQQYVSALVYDHGVRPSDIGVVTPYIRQVYKIKQWARDVGLGAVEVGTVEAFQGKEKRVVVISCVRAQHALLQHDAKYQLGFLVDDQRFNVAITRAKAKTIVIGNPVVLQRDEKWRRYIERCDQLGTHRGFRAPQPSPAAPAAPGDDDVAPMLQHMQIV